MLAAFLSRPSLDTSSLLIEHFNSTHIIIIMDSFPSSNDSAPTNAIIAAYHHLPSKEARSAFLKELDETMREAVVESLHAKIEAFHPSQRTPSMLAVSPGPSLPADDYDVESKQASLPAIDVVDDGHLKPAAAVDGDSLVDGASPSPAPKRRCVRDEPSSVNPAQYQMVNSLGASSTNSYGSLVDGPVSSQKSWLASAKVEVEVAKRQLKELRSQHNANSEQTSEAAAAAESADLTLKSLKRKYAKQTAEAERTRLAIVKQESIVEDRKTDYRHLYGKGGVIAEEMIEKRAECNKLVLKIAEAETPYAGNKPTSSVRADISLESLFHIAFHNKTKIIVTYDKLKAGGYDRNCNVLEKSKIVQDFLQAVKRNPSHPVPAELQEWLSLAGYQGPNDIGDLKYWAFPFGKTYTKLHFVKYRLAFYLDLEIDCVLKESGYFDDYLPGFGPNA